jgi:hypothetical protein
LQISLDVSPNLSDHFDDRNPPTSIASLTGTASFVVRGFGPGPFKMNGFLGEANDAVQKAAGKGQPVTQNVALSVKGSNVECSSNGTVVARYDKALLATGGKLKSADGTYGVRFGHKTDVIVTGLTMTKD